MLHIQMPPERQPQPPSRRDFLRLAIGVPIGAVLGAGTQIGHDTVANGINDHTFLKPDSDFNEREAIALDCGDMPTKECINNVNSDPGRRLYDNVTGPAINHALFGVVPSYFLDFHNQLTDSRIDPSKNALFGDGEWRLFTRKEMLVGCMTAGFLVTTNRLVSRGRDTDVVPFGDISGSLVSWWVQRRLGYIASLSGGIVYNVLETLRQAKRFGR